MLNDSFILNNIGRKHLISINSPIIEYLKFYECTLKSILTDLDDIRIKKLEYLEVPYIEQVETYQNKIVEINNYIVSIGKEVVESYE